MRNIKWIIIAVVVLVIIAVPVVQFVRPLPQLVVQADGATSETIAGKAPSFDWPKQGQAALSVVGVGDLGHSGDQTAVPIASVTKVMTAYLVLQKHPLKTGEQGPSLTVSKADYQTYLSDSKKGESVLKVRAGEKLTERQALEGLLLPSGNNIASLLAEWCSGSVDKFVAQMNQTAKSLGMTNTHYADASGYLPASASTAVDQIKLLEHVINDSTFRSIISMPQATLPAPAGTVYNVDYIMGQDGIIGGKTGSTSQAGGCFVFGSQKKINGHEVTMVGAVIGQKTSHELETTFDVSKTLSKEGLAALQEESVVKADDPVATLQAPWANKQVLRADQDVSVIGWPGMKVSRELTPVKNMKSHLDAGTTVATLTIQVGNQKKQLPLKTAQAVTGPSYMWRLRRL